MTSESADDPIPCPFTYANGKRCPGHVFRAKAFGQKKPGRLTRERVRKYRLWCTLKSDHAGAVPNLQGKRRMEFYPDQLPDEMLDRLWAEGMVET